MKKIIVFIGLIIPMCVLAQNTEDILKKVDKNMSAETKVIEASVTIYGARNSRNMKVKVYTIGTTKSFTEFLEPAREKGTKMLKLGSEMWVYSPSTDRTIMISGHMLRQAVMGSDMSYEDMMDDRKLNETYTAVIEKNETVDGRNCHVMNLTTKEENIAYPKQKIWIDVERNLLVKQELIAKSGQLIKRIEFSDIKQVSGRWFAMKMSYKDMMKDGKGTDFIITSVLFDQKIPESVFNKGNLKK